ncbi:MAG: diaminopropionate ammonia-lyase [Tissierellia bacterium]|nr:diaminopropionate ammonia-lyase [Tissierellia bacterium]
MTETYKIVHNDVTKREQIALDFINEKVVQQTLKFHSSFEQYEETPLVNLKEAAKYFGVKDIFVKDESYRFGLNAFKVLGGTWAIGKYIADKLGVDIDELPASRLTSKEVKDKVGEITFVSATDGNHGRGVAWAAQQLGQKCVILMPDGSSLQRRDAIRAHGATCDIMEGMNYDECVRLANKHAEEEGWVMVQDTAWDGYEKIPTWIFQGYATMAYEAYLEMEKAGKKPTHIFVQAGVGSLATGVTGFFSSVLKGEDKPIITVVEPTKASCLYNTAEADDGTIHNVTGEMRTIMAGLACGEPVTIGWPVLHAYADNFVAAPDLAAARGMRILGNPLKGDTAIISGESGAAPFGAFTEIMEREDLKEFKETIGLDEDSVVLFFSTEGDTDFKHYREVVWDGRYPTYRG